MESHLLQMRGLKPGVESEIKGSWVASFTDAWIETSFQMKPATHMESHLLQMRGLKRDFESFAPKLKVASFTDAWIETYRELTAC